MKIIVYRTSEVPPQKGNMRKKYIAKLHTKGNVLPKRRQNVLLTKKKNVTLRKKKNVNASDVIMVVNQHVNTLVRKNAKTCPKKFARTLKFPNANMFLKSIAPHIMFLKVPRDQDVLVNQGFMKNK